MRLSVNAKLDFYNINKVILFIKIPIVLKISKFLTLKNNILFSIYCIIKHIPLIFSYF